MTGAEKKSTRRGGRLTRTAKRVLVLLAVFVAVGVAIPGGCIGNRVFNKSPADYLRTFETAGGLPFALAVVEFDDQGEPWDTRQLEDALALIRKYNEESEHGVVLYQFIHGWKHNASREEGEESRLAWFEKQVAGLAERSDRGLGRDPGARRPVVGLYIGWRGRTYSLPLLIDASYWNRRVAASRVASMRLLEVLYRTANAANEHPDSKCVLVGHSMGGLVLERTLGPAIVTTLVTAEQAAKPAPLQYDLIVSANPSVEALYSKQLIDILKRGRTRLVLEDESGNLTDAGGPLLASITSEADEVTRRIFPFAMGINSVFVRYRGYSDPGSPTQRQLGLHTAGHMPYVHSHTVELRNGEVVFQELPRRWNDTPFWVFQIPREISGGHSDIDSPLWGELMLALMEENEVFDPDLDLRLVGAGSVPAE
jgi:hypothetical protein